MKSKTYEEFVDKFKPKKTTDDCYTPPIVYDAVSAWVEHEHNVDRSLFVRPFYPGGDYENYDYTADCIVVDNPPFSILAKIKRFYAAHGVRYFLFAPTLTLFSSGDKGITYIPCGVAVEYENGAKVNTSFVTNLDTCLVRTAPGLYQCVENAVDALRKTKRAELPKYEYPDEVITAAMVARWCKYGVDFRLAFDSAQFTRALDEQKRSGKAIFGGGYLLAERAAAERAAAERAAAERATAERAAAERAAAERAAAERWTLSERERQIVRSLGSD